MFVKQEGIEEITIENIYNMLLLYVDEALENCLHCKLSVKTQDNQIQGYAP